MSRVHAATPLSALGAALAIVLPSLAAARTIPYPVVRAESGFSAGIGALNQDYTETANGAVLDQETGAIPVFTLSASGISSNPQGGLYWRLQGRAADGNTHYDGHYLNGAPAQTTTANTMVDIDGRVGFAYGLGRRTALIPYLALGDHHWQRNVGSGQGAGGIEDYSNGYLGAGIRWEMVLAPHLILAAHGSGGYTFGAQITATDPVYYDAPSQTYYYARETKSLGDRPYVAAGVRATYLLGRVWQAYVAVDAVRFAYGASASTPIITSSGGAMLGYYEPDSRTTQVLVTAGAGIRF